MRGAHRGTEDGEAGGPGVIDLLRLVPRGGPAICNVSVTNVCNATCDFCNFAHDKGFVTAPQLAGRGAASRRALALLRERAGVRFVTFMGGEPLLHPKHRRDGAGRRPTWGCSRRW